MAVREQAQSLRQRLNDHAVDIQLLATEALAVFEAAGSPVHVTWLKLELAGYAAVTRRAPLHEWLGVAATDRLVVHVSSYRMQRGQIVDGGGATGRPFSHFFVESISELVAASVRVRRGVAGTLRLDFGPPNIPNYPMSGTFPTDVFERVLLGLRAVLHLQLGTIA